MTNRRHSKRQERHNMQNYIFVGSVCLLLAGCVSMNSLDGLIHESPKPGPGENFTVPTGHPTGAGIGCQWGKFHDGWRLMNCGGYLQ